MGDRRVSPCEVGRRGRARWAEDVGVRGLPWYPTGEIQGEDTTRCIGAGAYMLAGIPTKKYARGAFSLANTTQTSPGVAIKNSSKSTLQPF